MGRNRSLSVKKSLAFFMTTVVMMSHGVAAYADGMGTKTGVVAFADSGDVIKTAEKVELKDDTGAEAIGVGAVSESGYEAGVTIEGGVTVEESGKDGIATGVLGSSKDKESIVDVKIEGDLKSESKMGRAEGVNNTLSEGASAEIDIDGNVDVKAEGDAWGIVAVGDNDNGLKATVGGNVEVDSETGEAYGSLNDLSKGSKVEIGIKGDLDVEAGKVGYGIMAEAEEDTEFKVKVDGGIGVKGSGMASQGINIQTDGKASVDVGENVTSDGFGVMAAALNDKENEVSISVGGDVTAGFSAVLIVKSEDSSVDLTVDGTIKGENHNIVFSPDTKGNITTKGVDITVWKIDTEKTGGRTAETFESDKFEDYSDKAAEVINYIIKVDDTAKLTPDVDTAKEGETVFLEVNVPSGYAVDSFYTAESGTNVDVVKDDSGKYYLVVPRGGGVFVGVTLKADKKTNPTDKSDSKDKSNPTDKSDSKDKSKSTDESNSTVKNNSRGDNDYSSSDDGNDSGKDANNSRQGGVFTDNTGRTVDLGGRVSAPQSVMVKGEQVSANVSVSTAAEGMEKAFSDVLGMVVMTGMADLGGNMINVPADAHVKESFTFEAAGMNGFVTTYLDMADYKAGDVIICSYFDAFGNPVLVAITPDMINGTSLLLTIPASCTLALAGSEV